MSPLCAWTAAWFHRHCVLGNHLIGQHQDAGVQLAINGDYKSDIEPLELFAEEIMPHFT